MSKIGKKYNITKKKLQLKLKVIKLLFRDRKEVNHCLSTKKYFLLK